MTKDQKYRRSLKGQYTELRRAAKRKGVRMTLTIEEFARFRSYPCLYCGEKLSEASYSLDRIKPGGDYSKENCVASCWDCNRARNTNEDRLEVALFGAIKGVLRQYTGKKRNKSRAS